MLQRKTTSTRMNKEYYYFSQNEHDWYSLILWGSTYVGGKAHTQMAFCNHSCWLGIDAFATQRCPASIRVGIDLAPLHPMYPEWTSRVWGASPAEAEQKLSLPPMSHPSGVAWGKQVKLAKWTAFCCLLPCPNRGSLQEFISVLRGEPQGCARKELPWQLCPQWVYMG